DRAQQCLRAACALTFLDLASERRQGVDPVDRAPLRHQAARVVALDPCRIEPAGPTDHGLELGEYAFAAQIVQRCHLNDAPLSTFRSGAALPRGRSPPNRGDQYRLNFFFRYTLRTCSLKL